MPAAAGAFEIKVQSADLQKMYVDLRAAGSQLTVQLRRGVVKAAKPLQDAVKAEAGFSRRIPGAVKTKASFAARKAGVTIYVDSKRAPEAAPINNKGKSGRFRHPVFGHDVWVSQEAHPFFDPPIRAHLGAVDKAMLAVLDEIAAKAGFR